MKHTKNNHKSQVSKILFSLIVLLLSCWITGLLNSSPAFAQGKDLGTLKGLPGAYEPSPEKDTIEGPGKALSSIFTNTFGVLTIVAGLSFTLYFILGGLTWITAGGKTEKVEQAKQQMTNAIIGLIIVVAAYGITFIIGNVLGIPILQPDKFLPKLKPGG